jgi:DegV family protein with EDD domain
LRTIKEHDEASDDVRESSALVVSVAIVTDSAAALPAELAAAYGVAVVPMMITVDGRSGYDGATTIEAILTASEVETAGPSPGNFADAIERVMTPEGVLVLTLASSMSSTNGSASMGASGFAERARVVDTQTAAGAQALVVLAAARATEAGASLDEVVRVARDVVRRVHFIAMVPNLDFLVKSGRVPGIAQWVGRRVHVSPIFEFKAGDVVRHRPALGADAAYDRMVQALRRDRVDGAVLHVAVSHAFAAEAAARLLALVKGFVLPEEEFIGEFGSVMVAHTGPGLVGLAWWWEAR